MLEGRRTSGAEPNGRIGRFGVDLEPGEQRQTRPRLDRIHAGADARGRPETAAFSEYRPHVEIHHDESGGADEQAGSEHDPGAGVDEFSGCGSEIHSRTRTLLTID